MPSNLYLYHFKTFRKCDLLDCNKQSSMWTVFNGCGHSFHVACVLPDIRHCPICKAALLSRVKELGQTANASVSNVSVPCTAEESNESEELSDDDEDEHNLADEQSETINIDTLLQRIRQWRTLESSRDCRDDD